MKRVIVIPAYNEAATIAVVAASARPYGDVVVVDDGSQDATAYEARRAGANVLRHLVNRGQGASLMTGTRKALALGADVIVHFDADGQHDAADIPALVAPIEAGIADAVFGSRFLGSAINMPKSRRIALKGATLITRWATGLAVSDAHNGLRALSCRVAPEFRITHDRMAHNTEIVHFVARKNLAWREVPVTVRYTPYSLRKGQHLTDASRILFDLIVQRLFTR